MSKLYFVTPGESLWFGGDRTLTALGLSQVQAFARSFDEVGRYFNISFSSTQADALDTVRAFGHSRKSILVSSLGSFHTPEGQKLLKDAISKLGKASLAEYSYTPAYPIIEELGRRSAGVIKESLHLNLPERCVLIVGEPVLLTETATHFAGRDFFDKIASAVLGECDALCVDSKLGTVLLVA
jgi:broad specificity phosphatase PhoE